MALPFSQVSALSKITNWNVKVVIDATNHFTADFNLIDTGGKASSEIVQDHLLGARLFKAFNTLYSKILAEDPNAHPDFD
ncbi:NAD(P)-binding domain-containing protein [Ohtaekwangia koreensis]|uniref:hypothetical protein n=1 Tax=Ohtaekwangia koreensis TaxID=688867 RepID=UPI0009A8529C|nr:hypothetical protein [Ohtaekwangia koreensis]